MDYGHEKYEYGKGVHDDEIKVAMLPWIGRAEKGQVPEWPKKLVVVVIYKEVW